MSSRPRRGSAPPRCGSIHPARRSPSGRPARSCRSRCTWECRSTCPTSARSSCSWATLPGFRPARTSMQPPPPAKESAFDAGKYSFRTSRFHRRAVRLVAGLAGQPRRVVCRHHLRKALGFGGAGRVTAGAQHRRVGQTAVTEAGSSACLASAPWQASQFTCACFPPFFHVQNVRVAGFAGFVAGELHRMGGNLADGAPR
jgi:hypothetical protein